MEQCQQQWEAHQSIIPFTLGQRDISDRFQIPEKLYGRETEVATLLAAFDRISKGRTEMMLVAGFSGIGKTALVNEVHKPMVRQRGYFIKGKFDQFKRDIPFSALVQAFQMLMGQLLTETTTRVANWKTHILKALGENAQVIIEVIPELEQIIGKQPPVPELEGSATQNRFNRLFQQFINVFSTAEHPLVIFVDDLQWIDSASLKLIQLLMSETDSHYLLLIGAYRDNEVNAAHPLILTLEEIWKTQVLVNQITLGPLAQPDLNRLIADTLSCPTEKAASLTALVLQKTQGNPFFTNQFLKFLHEEQLIAFDFDDGYWRCDITQVKLVAVNDNVVEFIALQLQKLPSNTQNVLKLAACIGNQFDLATLAIVHEKSQADTATDLWKALQEGFIIPISDVYKFFQTSESNEALEVQALSVPYKFLHDRVQQAAYSLIPKAQKAITHLKIGQLLKDHTSEEEFDEKMFDIVNQLNQGIDFISEQTERDKLAVLNLQAGNKAKASTAYVAANQYLTTGIELLIADSWQSQYDLTLSLYESATEAAYLSGHFLRQQQLTDIVLDHAQSLLDKVKVYKIQVSSYIAQNKQPEAVKAVLPVLKLLGVTFPEEPSQEDIMRGLQETQALLEGKPIESLCELPLMTEPEQLATLQILSSIVTAAYQATQEILPLMIFKQVQLSLNYGNTPESIVTYAIYGMLIIALYEEIEVGYQFIQLASNLLEKLNAKEFTAKKCVAADTAIICKIHIRDTPKAFIKGYQAGLEVGDLEHAAYCAAYYCIYSFFAGEELTGLEHKMANYSEAIVKLNQKNTLNYTNIYWQSVLNLRTDFEEPWQLKGIAYNEINMLPQHQQANDGYAIFNLYLQKMTLGYLFQNNRQTLENGSLAERHVNRALGIFPIAVFYFYYSLIQLAVYPDAQAYEQPALLEKVAANQEKMQHWAKHAPMNFQHKFDLVEAERLRVLGQNTKAMDFYDRAIAGAIDNHYLQEEALANELAARFYLAWGKEKIAKIYMTEAYYCYARWGAKAKVDDLDERYPELLAPIINDTLATSPTNKTTSTLSTKKSMVTTVNSLDFTTVIKASQVISGEIRLEQLLSTLMKVLVENAGAEKGTFILQREGQLFIEAQYGKSGEAYQNDGDDFCVLQTIPVEESQAIPLSLINYVSRTLKIQLFNDAREEITFAADPYFEKWQPKSVLCLPILNHGKLIGVLYLENNLTTHAFTNHRLEVLKILSSTTAVSLENAYLYKTLEDKVLQRTEQLAQANEKIMSLNEQLKSENLRMSAELDVSRQLQQISNSRPKKKYCKINKLKISLSHRKI